MCAYVCVCARLVGVREGVGWDVKGMGVVEEEEEKWDVCEVGLEEIHMKTYPMSEDDAYATCGAYQVLVGATGISRRGAKAV